MSSASSPFIAESVATSSIEVIYRAHVGFVWRALRRFGIDDEDLEDATHEVFLVLQRKLASYDGRSAITTWLYGITRGIARNRRRGKKRARLRMLKMTAPEPPPNPETELERARAADSVETFLETLDAARREVFVLIAIEQMTAPEVAELLKVNVNTVYTRLRAARKAFRAHLSASSPAQTRREEL